MANATKQQFNNVTAVGVTLDQLQQLGWMAEAGRVAAADTVELTLPVGDRRYFPPGVRLYTHNGGLTNGVNGNWAINNGSTIEFQITAPDLAELAKMNGHQPQLAPVATSFNLTHTLSGLTDGAATPAQVAASLAADTALAHYLYFQDAVTANRVTAFPKSPRGKVAVLGGTANAVMQFSGSADNATRVFTLVPIVASNSWTVTYDAATGKLTATNGTGSAVVRVVLHAQIV